MKSYDRKRKNYSYAVKGYSRYIILTIGKSFEMDLSHIFGGQKHLCEIRKLKKMTEKTEIYSTFDGHSIL